MNCMEGLKINERKFAENGKNNTKSMYMFFLLRLCGCADQRGTLYNERNTGVTLDSHCRRQHSLYMTQWPAIDQAASNRHSGHYDQATSID